MFINDKDNWDKGEDMHSNALQNHRRGEYSKYPRKTRGPRFALIIMIIMAMISIALALTVVYIFT
ncbi:MAG: hypothetical protein JSV09_06690 [Thermoplasmata archaeon]|nr:MAG: hypothetical protein JSV09_06690 [Thermoplasmata archaeon]